MAGFDVSGYYEQQFGDRVRGIRKGGAASGGCLTGLGRIILPVAAIIVIKGLILGFGSHRGPTYIPNAHPLHINGGRIMIPFDPPPPLEVPLFDPLPNPDELRGPENIRKLLRKLEEEERQRLQLLPPFQPEDQPPEE